RLRIEGASSKADIVLGFDTNLTAEARDLGLFGPHGVDTAALNLPVPWTDDTFLPYDYGYFAFVYNRDKFDAPPARQKQLVDVDKGSKILVQDLRTSTPGLSWLL